MTAFGLNLLVDGLPAPASLLAAVQEIQVEASTQMASVFRMRIGIGPTGDGDWTILSDDTLAPLSRVTVRAQTGSSAPVTILNGYVSEQHVTYGEGPRRSTLEVTGMDATLLMNLEEKVAAWPNLPDSQIAAAIFGSYRIIPKVETTPIVLAEPEGTTTQRGTDIRFLRRLAARNGFDCFVQPDPLLGVDVGHFGPPDLDGPPQAVLSVAFGLKTNVTDFNVRYDMVRPTSAIERGLDIATKEIQRGEARTESLKPLGNEPTIGQLDPPPVVRPADKGLMRSPELQADAQAVVDEASFAVVADGRVAPHVGVLRPGRTVAIRGAGRVFSGTYYVTRVWHTLAPQRYAQRFEARRNAIVVSPADVFVGL